MIGELAVRGEQLEALFLCLDQEQLVERVPVTERDVECPRRMSHGHGHEHNLLILQDGKHSVWVKGALARPEPIACVVLQAHLPDRHGTDVQA